MGISPATETKKNLITLNLKWFSVLAEHRGKRIESVQMKQDITGLELMEHLSKEFPMLDKYRDHVRLAINREYAEPDAVLKDGDEVAFITPVSGG
jgi:molybdopterin converting factor subunit 1